MYNTPYFIPNLYNNIPPSMIMNNAPLRGLGFRNLFSRLTNTFNTIKGFNWTGIINNTSKTLGIINQTIPVIKQVGPMTNNIKSMIKVASIFKDETDTNNRKKQPTNYYKTKTKKKENIKTTNQDDDESPTFFINS